VSRKPLLIPLFHIIFRSAVCRPSNWRHRTSPTCEVARSHISTSDLTLDFNSMSNVRHPISKKCFKKGMKRGLQNTRSVGPVVRLLRLTKAPQIAASPGIRGIFATLQIDKETGRKIEMQTDQQSSPYREAAVEHISLGTHTNVPTRHCARDLHTSRTQ